MAVQGPIGFRSLLWDDEKQIFTSPVQKFFKWEKKNYEITGECMRDSEHHKLIAPENAIETDEKIVKAFDSGDILSETFYEEIPAFHCRCGLFCALDFEEALGYSNEQKIVLLCEGGDKIVLHDNGFRAKEITYLAIVNFRYDNLSEKLKESTSALSFYLADMIHAVARDYFNIPSVSYSAAIKAVEMQWRTFGMTPSPELAKALQDIDAGG